MKKLQISFNLGTGQEGVEKPQEHGPSTACFAWGSFGEKKTQKKQPLMEAPSNDAFRKATP